MVDVMMTNIHSLEKKLVLRHLEILLT